MRKDVRLRNALEPLPKIWAEFTVMEAERLKVKALPMLHHLRAGVAEEFQVPITPDGGSSM